jgi:hypothetical protein
VPPRAHPRVVAEQTAADDEERQEGERAERQERARELLEPPARLGVSHLGGQERSEDEAIGAEHHEQLIAGTDHGLGHEARQDDRERER